jgi:hypothetical protein
LSRRICALIAGCVSRSACAAFEKHAKIDGRYNRTKKLNGNVAGRRPALHEQLQSVPSMFLADIA